MSGLNVPAFVFFLVAAFCAGGLVVAYLIDWKRKP